MVERVYERQCGSTIQRATIVESGGDAHRCLVDIWNAKVDFSHDHGVQTAWVANGGGGGFGIFSSGVEVLRAFPRAAAAGKTHCFGNGMTALNAIDHWEKQREFSSKRLPVMGILEDEGA